MVRCASRTWFERGGLGSNLVDAVNVVDLADEVGAVERGYNVVNEADKVNAVNFVD